MMFGARHEQQAIYGVILDSAGRESAADTTAGPLKSSIGELSLSLCVIAHETGSDGRLPIGLWPTRSHTAQVAEGFPHQFWKATNTAIETDPGSLQCDAGDVAAAALDLPRHRPTLRQTCTATRYRRTRHTRPTNTDDTKQRTSR